MERLFTVCKILSDVTVLKLKGENEALKLELFWAEHNIDAFHALIENMNDYDDEGDVKCECSWCMSIWDDEHRHETCTRAPVTTRIAAKYGLTMRFVGSMRTNLDRARMDWHKFNFKGQEFVAGSQFEDVHIAYYQEYNGRVNWVYGPALWKVTSVKSKELLKLRMLFQHLKYCGGDPSENMPESYTNRVTAKHEAL